MNVYTANLSSLDWPLRRKDERKALDACVSPGIYVPGVDRRLRHDPSVRELKLADSDDTMYWMHISRRMPPVMQKGFIMQAFINHRSFVSPRPHHTNGVIIRIITESQYRPGFLIGRSSQEVRCVISATAPGSPFPYHDAIYILLPNRMVQIVLGQDNPVLAVENHDGKARLVPYGRTKPRPLAMG